MNECLKDVIQKSTMGFGKHLYAGLINFHTLEKKLFNGGENPFASITNQIICKHRFKKKSLCFELEVKEMAFIVCVCVAFPF